MLVKEAPLGNIGNMSIVLSLSPDGWVGSVWYFHMIVKRIKDGYQIKLKEGDTSTAWIIYRALVKE